MAALLWIPFALCFAGNIGAESRSVFSKADKHKPVVLIHGLEVPVPLPVMDQDLINFSKIPMKDLKEMILKMGDLKAKILEAHPGTNVTIPDLFDNSESLLAVKYQLPKFREAIEKVMRSSKDGINLICYSQGGIICRSLLANMSDHNVHTFISLSAPQMGQYGDTSYIPVLPQLKKDVYKFCYNAYGQGLVSICNYWKDPHRFKEYLVENTFLPILNNETYNSKSQIWKNNFMRIKQLILIGGPDDGVITPWQSSHFGFYNEDEQIVEMQRQEVFLKDSFGLKTLYNQGRIKTFNISGVNHTKWHGNQTVFDCCIEPFLT